MQSFLLFILDLVSQSTSRLCCYQEMELLDITSIRDTRFGKFAKMPKVNGPEETRLSTATSSMGQGSLWGRGA